jgi:hypothetical protein
MMLKTPDITPAQLVGLVSAAVGTASAFGFDLTAIQQHVLIADAGVVGALLLGDAVVRHGRATGNAEKTATPTMAANPELQDAIAHLAAVAGAASKKVPA